MKKKDKDVSVDELDKQYASRFTKETYYKKVEEKKEIYNRLLELQKRIAEHLGIEEIPIEFVNEGTDSSRLILKPKPKIQITDFASYKYERAAFYLAHEMRHAFQIYWASLMGDKLAEVWREELADVKNSENIDPDNPEDFAKYNMQAIEIDADAFAIHYLKTYEKMNYHKPQKWLNDLVEAYIVKYKDRL